MNGTALASPAASRFVAVRRSLAHLLLGKALAAGTGLAVLMLKLRVLGVSNFGVVVALLAFVEVYYLLTAGGLSTMAQREVPRWHAQQQRQGNGTPTTLWPRLATLLGLRLLLALAGALLVMLWWPELIHWLNGPPDATLGWFYGAWLVLGCGARYVEELLSALMMQGALQGLSLLMNLLRLAALALMGAMPLGLPLPALAFTPSPTAEAWVVLEAACSLVFLAIGAGLILRALGRGSSDGAAVLQGTPKQALQTVVALGPWKTAWGYWLVQIMSLAFSGQTLRLLAAALGSSAMAALMGVCLSLTEMARNVLPTTLLANWLRTLMINDHARSGLVHRACRMAEALFRFSLLAWIPWLVLVCWEGNPLLRWVAAGRLSDDVLGDAFGGAFGHAFSHAFGGILGGAIGSAAISPVLLGSLGLLVVLQMLHQCMGLVCSLKTGAAGVIRATAASLACMVLLSLLLWSWGGLLGLVLAAAGAELCWLLMVDRVLRADAASWPWIRDSWTTAAWAALACAVSGGLCSVLAQSLDISGVVALVLVLMAAGAPLLPLIALRPPQDPEERLWMGRLLPARLQWLRWTGGMAS